MKQKTNTLPSPIRIGVCDRKGIYSEDPQRGFISPPNVNVLTKEARATLEAVVQHLEEQEAELFESERSYAERGFGFQPTFIGPWLYSVHIRTLIADLRRTLSLSVEAVEV